MESQISSQLDDLKRWLRERDAAVHVGLAPSTMAKLRLSGSGPRYVKMTRAIVYDRRELDRWMEDRMIRSTSETPSPA